MRSATSRGHLHRYRCSCVIPFIVNANITAPKNPKVCTFVQNWHNVLGGLNSYSNGRCTVSATVESPDTVVAGFYFGVLVSVLHARRNKGDLNDIRLLLLGGGPVCFSILWLAAIF